MQLELFRRDYRVPMDGYLWAPTEDKRVDQPPPGYIAVHKGAMDVGLRFPLHLVISRLLASWDIAPSQIVVMSWYIIFGLLALFAKTRGESDPYHLTPHEFAYLFLFIERGKWWFFLKAHNHVKLVEDVPNKIRDWHVQWFFVSGEFQCMAVRLESAQHHQISGPRRSDPDVFDYRFHSLIE